MAGSHGNAGPLLDVRAQNPNKPGKPLSPFPFFPPIQSCVHSICSCTPTLEKSVTSDGKPLAICDEVDGRIPQERSKIPTTGRICCLSLVLRVAACVY